MDCHDSGGDDADALLFCRRDPLLDNGRAALATEPQARNVDPVLQTIVERRHKVAATRVGRQPADVQIAVRRIAADAVRNALGAVRNGADDARARRAVAHEIL